MGALLGLLLGVGLLLCWRSGPRAPQRRTADRAWTDRRNELLRQAGMRVAELGAVAGRASRAPAVLSLLVVQVITETLAVAACFALFAFFAPVAVVRRLRLKRQVALRELWPEAIDNLASAVRAGMSLPEGVSGLGTTGPEAAAAGVPAVRGRLPGRGPVRRLPGRAQGRSGRSGRGPGLRDAAGRARGRRHRPRHGPANAVRTAPGRCPHPSRAGDPAGLDGQRRPAGRRRALAGAAPARQPVQRAAHLRLLRRRAAAGDRCRGLPGRLPDHAADRTVARRTQGVAMSWLGGLLGLGLAIGVADCGARRAAAAATEAVRSDRAASERGRRSVDPDGTADGSRPIADAARAGPAGARSRRSVARSADRRGRVGADAGSAASDRAVDRRGVPDRAGRLGCHRADRRCREPARADRGCAAVSIRCWPPVRR